MQRFFRQKVIEIIRKNETLCSQSRKLNKYLDMVRTSIERNIPRRAEIDPLELLHVYPDDIKLMSNNSPHNLDSLLISPVLEGDWDKNVQPLEEYDLYVSLQSRFKSGKEWEETEFYSRVRKEFERDKSLSKWGCTDFQEFKDKLDSIDELYQTIKQEGTKHRNSLGKKGRTYLAIVTLLYLKEMK